MAGEPRNDGPTWAGELREAYEERGWKEVAVALQAVAAGVGDAVLPADQRDQLRWSPDLAGETQPAVGTDFEIVLERPESVRIDRIQEPDQLRSAANELLATLYHLYHGVRDSSYPIDETARKALIQGVQLLQIDTENLGTALVNAVPAAQTTAAQTVIDKIKQKVKAAIGKLWNFLTGMGTLDSWQVSGSIGTSVPGFTGNVSLGLTFT